jgi:hypothetical protein
MPTAFELPVGVALALRAGGSPWGSTFPPKANPPAPASDGRTVALDVLGDYVTALNFYRAGSVGGQPSRFNVPRKNFFNEWPDDVQTMPFPCFVVVHARGKYRAIGLTTYVEEDSRDLYGQGTVVQWQGEYIETIQLEVWTNTVAERAAIRSSVETALSPVEQMSGVRFRMQGYFDELVTFTLNDCYVMDDAGSARRQRRMQFGIEMRFNVVALVNYQPLIVVSKANVGIDEDTGLPVTTAINATG